jgi:ATP-dependent RNA helicase SUPV3L1/SUV3
VRKLQAQNFNDPTSGYDVLVASDAVGMGLNLNIRRIVFSTVYKWDGKETRKLTTSEVLQISGRAGRFNSIYPTGLVTTLYTDHLSHVHHCFASANIPPIAQAGLTPTLEHITQIKETYPDMSLTQVLEHISANAALDSIYFLCTMKEMVKISEVLLENEQLQKSPLRIYDLFTFCQAPVNSEKHPTHIPLLIKFAVTFSKGETISLPTSFRKFGSMVPKSPAQIMELEEAYSHLDIYVWLGHRLGVYVFVDMEDAIQVRSDVANNIHKGLQSMTEKGLFMKTIRPRHDRHMDGFDFDHGGRDGGGPSGYGSNRFDRFDKHDHDDYHDGSGRGSGRSRGRDRDKARYARAAPIRGTPSSVRRGGGSLSR